MAYLNQSFNISMNGSYKNSLDNEKMAKLVNEIDGVDDYLVATEYYFDVENPDMTKQYSDYFKSYDESTVYTTFAILVLDDKSYSDYAKKAGISDDNGTGILINKSNLYIYDEETEKETKAETKLFNYKAGDTLTLGYNVYDDSSDTTNIENSENNTGMVRIIVSTIMIRAYNRNYNATIERLCGMIQEEYPDIDGSSIARILNDEAVRDNDSLLESGNQFLKNIVKNAVEHAASKVTIGYYKYELYNEIIVENDGDAISEEDKKNIFKRFYRGENSTADSIGIGLSLAETIIRHDNGYIMVDDVSDDPFISKNECSGTRFVIRYL